MSSARVQERQELTLFKELTNRQGQKPQSCAIGGNFFASLQTAQIVLSASVSLFYSSYMAGLLDAMAAGAQRQDMNATSMKIALKCT